MKRKRNALAPLCYATLACLWGLTSSLTATAEDAPIPWDKVFAELADRATDEETVERWSEQLLELAEQPLALNQASRDMLDALPFLSSGQVESLSYYLYRYGPMKDLSELALIEGLDAGTIELIMPFVCTGSTSGHPTATPVWSTLRYGQHSLRYLTGRTLETKAGYQYPIKPALGYEGGPWTHTLRYAFTAKQRLQAGFTLQKDAGEPWLVNGRWPDYSAFHVSIKDMGSFKHLLLGDYTVTMGQGLVCGQGFQLGKTLTTINPCIGPAGFKRHASSAETGFFRGVALEAFLYERRKGSLITFSLTGRLFVSRTRHDGRLAADTLSALLKTGLHRSRAEAVTRKTAPVWSAGGSLMAAFLNGHLTINSLCWHLEPFFAPTWQPYNQFNFRGRTGGCLSLDARWRFKQVSTFGEMAVSHNGHTALLAGMNLAPCSTLELSLLGRRYERGYQTFYGQAFGEHETVYNEEGVYLVMGWAMGPHLTLHANADLFRFPWLTYTTDEPATGQETGLMGTWRWGSRRQASVRYKARMLEKNTLVQGDKLPSLTGEVKHSLRLQYQEQWDGWQATTTLNTAALTIEQTSTLTTGFVLTQSLKHTWTRPAITLSGSLSWFDVADYAVRLSAYEPGVPGTFSMPIFEGQGCRWHLLLSAKLLHGVETWLKIGRWEYTDRTTIGTNLERIDASHRTDLQLMLRFKMGSKSLTSAKSLLPLQQ